MATQPLHHHHNAPTAVTTMETVRPTIRQTQAATMVQITTSGTLQVATQHLQPPTKVTPLRVLDLPMVVGTAEVHATVSSTVRRLANISTRNT